MMSGGCLNNCAHGDILIAQFKKKRKNVFVNTVDVPKISRTINQL